MLATSAWAQLASQTALVGTVTDSGGLVVPGAQVVAVNAGTKDTYEATTNTEGYYHIPFVRPGKYEITITIPSFQAFKTVGVEVATNQVVRTNATLHVGGVSESVNVSAEAQVLDTDRATVSETIDQRAIVELPLSGRNVWSLASTTPGVLGGLNSDIGLSFRGAGQREIQNSLSLDGINSSSNLLAATSMRPIADAVTEIQVQTGSTSAEYGAYLGVHINVVTKSGTNAPHGSIFEFYQDSALDARGYFENTALPKNPRERNQFGAQMDGPVVIPRLYDGRNKTFFMGAYEGVRGNATTSPFGSVPTAAMRRGDFSEIPTPIRNPFTGLAFPGNQIPDTMLSSTSKQLLQYYPAANRAGTANNLQAPSANTDNVDQVLARVDQNLGNKIRLERPLQLARQFQRQCLQRGHPRDGGHAAARQQELAGYLHAHTAAEPAQRFPHRLSPHRFRYREPLLCRRAGGRRDGARHSRVQRRHGRTTIPGSRASTSATSAGLERAARTGSSSTRRSRCRTCSPTIAVRTTSGAAST